MSARRALAGAWRIYAGLRGSPGPLSGPGLHALSFVPSPVVLRRAMWTTADGYTHFDGRGPYWTAERVNAWLRGVAVGGLGFGGVWGNNRETVPFTARRVAILRSGSLEYRLAGRIAPSAHAARLYLRRRKHMVLLPVSWERQLGAYMYRQLLDQFASKGLVLPSNHEYTKLVRQVGTRIAIAAGKGYGGGDQGHLKGMEWEFHVVKSDQGVCRRHRQMPDVL